MTACIPAYLEFFTYDPSDSDNGGYADVETASAVQGLLKSHIPKTRACTSNKRKSEDSDNSAQVMSKQPPAKGKSKKAKLLSETQEKLEKIQNENQRIELESAEIKKEIEHYEEKIKQHGESCDCFNKKPEGSTPKS